MKRPLKVAMIAGPWLSVPAKNYGGTESVIDYLCRGLMELGVEVHLFGVKGTSTPATKYYSFYDEEQFKNIHTPLNFSGPILAHHVLESLDVIRRDGTFDIIHDHNTYLGPTMLASLGPDMPPVLHTLHGPFIKEDQPDWPANWLMYKSLAKAGRLFFNGISNAQVRQAPPELKPKIVGAVHHGIDPSERTFYAKKGDYFINVGRIANDKNITKAIEISRAVGTKLVLAGTVAGLSSQEAIDEQLANRNSRYHAMPEFIYYRDKVKPLLEAGVAEYVGGVFGEVKDRLIGQAKAFIFPIEWEEPFGVAIIDALVCGTPVVAMSRGSLPEIIEHGVNGFLADNEVEFKKYLAMVDQIDPAACRQSVVERFSYKPMAESYLGKYIGISSQFKSVTTGAEHPSFERWAQAARRGLLQAGSFAETLSEPVAEPLED